MKTLVASTQAPKPVPSYAKATFSSNVKDAALQMRDPPPTGVPRVKRVSKLEGFHPYTMSTKSSRTKAKGLRFRLFALPAEIRYRIYHFISMDWHYRRTLPLTHRRHRGNGRTLPKMPALLRASPLLRQDAQGYYFSPGTFDILVFCEEIPRLIQWFRMIGSYGCQRLASNPNVRIRLVYSTRHCKSHIDATMWKHGYCFRASDIAEITRLRASLESITPPQRGRRGVKDWLFSVACSCTLGRDFYVHWPSPWHYGMSQEINISLPSLARFRTILRSVLTIATSGASSLTPEDNCYAWWTNHEPTGKDMWVTKIVETFSEYDPRVQHRFMIQAEACC